MSKCPSCNSGTRKRLTRNFLLKLVPNSKFYKCYRCKTKFINAPYFFSSIIYKKGAKELFQDVVHEKSMLAN
jgi:hypothetical protein